MAKVPMNIPLDEKIPKPLLLVRGKPFLQYQFELLKSFGVVDILLLKAQNIQMDIFAGLLLEVVTKYILEREGVPGCRQ